VCYNEIVYKLKEREMEDKTIQLNVPVRIEQVGKLSKAVAIVMASRERNQDNKRITKATFIRSLIDVIDFDEANLKDISNEEELQSTLKKKIGQNNTGTKNDQKLDVDILASIYRKFATDDQKKWVAGDFINTLFENGLVNAQSSEDLWGKILVETPDATK
jgi:fructose-1,6-bisphosphatase